MRHAIHTNRNLPANINRAPSLLLLDEVTSGIDPLASQAVVDYLCSVPFGGNSGYRSGNSRTQESYPYGGGDEKTAGCVIHIGGCACREGLADQPTRTGLSSCTDACPDMFSFSSNTYPCSAHALTFLHAQARRTVRLSSHRRVPAGEQRSSGRGI